MRNLFRPRFRIGRMLVMALAAYVMRQLANRQAQTGNTNTVVLPPDAVSETKRRNHSES